MNLIAEFTGRRRAWENHHHGDARARAGGAMRGQDCDTFRWRDLPRGAAKMKVRTLPNLRPGTCAKPSFEIRLRLSASPSSGFTGGIALAWSGLQQLVNRSVARAGLFDTVSVRRRQNTPFGQPGGGRRTPRDASDLQPPRALTTRRVRKSPRCPM